MTSKTSMKKMFLNNTFIAIYMIVYAILVIKQYLVMQLNTLLDFLVFVVLPLFIFYNGIKGIQLEKMWIKGFPMSKLVSKVFGYAFIILALVYLIFIWFNI